MIDALRAYIDLDIPFLLNERTIELIILMISY